MKRNFSVIFILLACTMLLVCFSGFTNKKVLAEEQFNASSKSAYLIDAHSGKVIYAKNEEQRLPIASMCKIMTLLLCFESIDNGEITLDQSITVSANASGMGGSQVFLEANAEYSVGELIKSIVVASANDACVAMAEKLCGSEHSFVEKMNNRANELGMNNTLFVNCTGLPKPGQYSCAKDVAKMFSELIKHKEYFRFSRIWTDKIIHPNERVTEIANTNKLVRFYNGCDGGKTGYTQEAGHCLSACAERNGTRLVSVVISAPDSKSRFRDVSSMFDYGFANFVNKIVIDDKKPLDLTVNVTGGKCDTVQVKAEKPFFIFANKNEKISVECDFVPSDKIKAPIYVGDLVGKVNIYRDGQKIGEVNVVANEDVLKKTYFDYIKDVGENWALINV